MGIAAEMTRSVLGSDPLSTLLVLSVVFLASFWLVRKAIRPGLKLPPGPRGYPLVGSLLSLGKQPHLALTSWTQRYGSSVLSCYLGNQLVLILNDFNSIREVCLTHSDEFSDRPPFEVQKFFHGDRPQGIIDSSRDRVTPIRRFTLKTLRDFGAGKSVMERQVLEEVNCLCEEFGRQENRSFEPGVKIQCAVCNVISLTLFGHRFDYDDPTLHGVLDAIDKVSRAAIGFGSLIQFMPWLRFLPVGFAMKDLVKLMQDTSKVYYDGIITKETVAHKKNFDENQINDVTDAYLREAKKRKEAGINDGAITAAGLDTFCSDLFFAGMETTSTTLKMGIILMLNHPNVQRKCQEELDRVIDGKRDVVMKDKPNLPYLEATIQELLRVMPIAPLGLTHLNKRPAKVLGFEIPAGTYIMTNLWAANMDPTEWKNPSEFNPDRFLDRQGKLINQNRLTNFGLGGRSCIGEILARMELFLFFANLLNRFSLKLPAGEPMPSDKGEGSGIILQTALFKLCATPRNV